MGRNPFTPVEVYVARKSNPMHGSREIEKPIEFKKSITKKEETLEEKVKRLEDEIIHLKSNIK